VGRQPRRATSGFAQVGFTSRGQFRAKRKFHTFALLFKWEAHLLQSRWALQAMPESVMR